MLNRHRITLAILGATFIIGASGCANGAGPTATNDNVITSDGAIIDRVISDDAPSRYTDSPLGQYWAMLRGTETNDINAINRNSLDNEDRIQELVAQCMREKGFDFIIHLPSSNPIGFDPDLWRPSDPEWIAQYGFGIIVAPTEPGMPLPGGQDMFSFGPNSEMLEGFTDSKQLAWRQAYWGSGYGTDEWSDDGCLQWGQSAQDAETAFGRVAASDEFAPLFEAMTEFHWNLVDEADRSEWVQDWSHCMADAGIPGLEFTWQLQSAFHQHVHTKLGQQWFDTQIDGPDLFLDPQFTALRAEEIEWAFINFDCLAAVDFWVRDLEFRTERENQFIEDHRAALNALRDAIEQHRL